jgi:hypothetical protein
MEEIQLPGTVAPWRKERLCFELLLNSPRKQRLNMKLLGGDWNHGFVLTFPSYWECHHPD